VSEPEEKKKTDVLSGIDLVDAMTRIHGSPSLDELFRDKGSNNCFNISSVEADRQMKNKIRNGGK
jgi:hypothetical protein